MGLEAFEREADPPELKLCRPCRDAAKIQPFHDCDGGECQCLICVQIKPIVKAMQEDWAWDQRSKGWRP